MQDAMTYVFPIWKIFLLLQQQNPSAQVFETLEGKKLPSKTKKPLLLIATPMMASMVNDLERRQFDAGFDITITLGHLVKTTRVILSGFLVSILEPTFGRNWLVVS